MMAGNLNEDYRTRFSGSWFVIGVHRNTTQAGLEIPVRFPSRF